MILELQLSGDDQLLRMPYGAGAGSGTPNIGYVNLMAHPEKISEIHELEGFPELEALVRYLNSPDCVFMSWRVDSGIDIYRLHPYSRCVSSFITVAFRNPNLRDDERYFTEFFNYLKTKATTKGVSDQAYCVVRITPFQYSARNVERGHCLDVYMQGHGHNLDDARNAWVSGMSALSFCLKSANNYIRLDNGGR